MPDTGWVFPTSSVGDRGPEIRTWSTPNNIELDDTVVTFIGFVENSATSAGLAAQTLGMGVLIPFGSTIDGIEFRFEGYNGSDNTGPPP